MTSRPVLSLWIFVREKLMSRWEGGEGTSKLHDSAPHAISQSMRRYWFLYTRQFRSFVIGAVHRLIDVSAPDLLGTEIFRNRNNPEYFETLCKWHTPGQVKLEMTRRDGVVQNIKIVEPVLAAVAAIADVVRYEASAIDGHPPPGRHNPRAHSRTLKGQRK